MVYFSLTVASATKGRVVFPTNPVIVLCYEDYVEPAIARSMLKHRWVLLDARKPVLKHVFLSRPHVVVVQAPPVAGPAAGMIGRLSQHWRPITIVAVASLNANETELEIRRAGADCFLPGPCEPQELEAVLEQMVPGVTRVGSPDGVRNGQADGGGKPGAYSRRSRRAH